MIKNIIKYTTILLLVLGIQGCGLFNKVFKTSSKYKEKSEVVTHKVENSIIKDSSKTVIEETIDTTVYTKPKKDKSNISIRDIKAINNLTLINNDFVNIRQTYDTLSNVLTTEVDVKPQPIDVKINKKTTIDNNITTNKTSVQDSTDKKDIKAKSSTKEKEPNILINIALGFGVLALLYFISKKFL